MGLEPAYMCVGNQPNQSYYSGLFMAFFTICALTGTDETLCTADSSGNIQPYCTWTGPAPAAGSYQAGYG